MLVQPAWCDGTPGAIAEAKQTAHDYVVAALGDRRTGAVRWLVPETVEASHELLDRLLDADSPQEWSDLIRRIRAHLREYGGVALVAMAPGRPGGPDGARS